MIFSLEWPSGYTLARSSWPFSVNTRIGAAQSKELKVAPMGTWYSSAHTKQKGTGNKDSRVRLQAT